MKVLIAFLIILPKPIHTSNTLGGNSLLPQMWLLFRASLKSPLQKQPTLISALTRTSGLPNLAANRLVLFLEISSHHFSPKPGTKWVQVCQRWTAISSLNTLSQAGFTSQYGQRNELGRRAWRVETKMCVKREREDDGLTRAIYRL